MEGNEEITQLGSKIKLTGFYKSVERGGMIIIKKIVGNYLNRIENKTNVDSLSLTLKVIHNTDNPQETKKYEIKASLICDLGKYHSDDIQDNIYTTIDEVLKKLEVQVSKDKEKAKGK